MDRSDMLHLITTTYIKDNIGQQVPVEQSTPVFCAVQSISAAEFSSAGQLGLKPEYRFVLFAYDYSGQTLVEYRGVRYSVYRTYLAGNEQIELYCERKAGTV